jgi:hypothetical protein
MHNIIRIKFALMVAMATLFLVDTGFSQDLDVSGMSGQEMLSDASNQISDIEGLLTGVQQLRERAEDEDGDIARIRCIGDKLAAIQGFLRLSTDARESLQQLSGGADSEEMEHQYRLIVIASQRVRNLNTEANQCAGDILTFAGETGADVEIDPTIPEDTDLTASRGYPVSIMRLDLRQRMDYKVENSMLLAMIIQPFI